MKTKDVRWMIYLYHTLSRWGDRMWDFSVGLYLVILYPSSLILTASLGFSVCLGSIIFGSSVGKWIDNNPRLKVANTALFVENAFVIIGCVLLAVNILYQAEIQPIFGGNLQPILFTLTIISAVISSLGSLAADIVIERDWIVVFSNGDDKKLSALNSAMRTIDLTTHIVAPLVIGQIITFVSPLAGTGFIGGWNFISAFIEYYLLSEIHKNIPELAEKPVTEKPVTENLSGSRFLSLSTIGESLRGFKIHFGHDIFYAGIGFALLFMTVMGFDSITLGYIYTQGASESFIGILTGGSAVFGIMASLIFPYLRANIGKHSTGNIGFGLNVMFLALCVGSVFAPGSPFNPEAILHPFEGSGVSGQTHVGKSIAQLWAENLNVFYFIVGIVLARFGLWLADLSVTQIMQDSVEENHRGIVNGVQNSLNQFMDLVKFMLIIILPSAEAFGFLIFLSWFAMCLAWMFFIVFVCTRRSVSSKWPSMEDLLLSAESKPLLLSQRKKSTNSYTNEVNENAASLAKI